MSAFAKEEANNISFIHSCMICEISDHLFVNDAAIQFAGCAVNTNISADKLLICISRLVLTSGARKLTIFCLIT